MIDKKICILLADDHPILRKGLAHIINDEEDMEIIGEASDGNEAIEQTRQLQPDIVIMDISMPNMSGIEATKIISADSSMTQIIGLSMCPETGEGKEMLEAGAVDFVSKGGPVDAILNAIRKAAAIH